MDEGRIEVSEARSRALVDQMRTCFPESPEFGVHVVRLERDVVHSGAAAGKEAADRGVLSGSREQLDPAVPHAEVGGLDSLPLDQPTALEGGPEETLVGRDRLVEVVHGHGDVVDPA